ncbi:hypothetical protein [Flavobacterium sp. GCM10023249]|uniref:hypothetical protein n=1 Tax=unclassified Flavobacterium TaxID=196869 RepID=UPI003614A7D8
MKKLLFTFLTISTSLFSQSDSQKRIIEENLPSNKYYKKEFGLKENVKDLKIIVSILSDNKELYEYKKNKLFYHDFHFDKKGKLITKGIIENPPFMPIEYISKDTLIYWENNKLKSIYTYGSEKHNRRFDQEGNEIEFKEISNEDAMTYTKKYVYNNLKQITKKIEYSPFETKSLDKNIDNETLYFYDKNKNVIKTVEKNPAEELFYTFPLKNRQYEQPLVTVYSYNVTKLKKVIASIGDWQIHSTNYNYDSNNALSSIEFESAQITTKSFFKDDLITEIIIATKNKEEKIKIQYEFDSKSNWIKMICNSSLLPQETLLIERTISYYE